MEKQGQSVLKSVILCFRPDFYPSVLRQSAWRSLLYLAFICLMVYGFLGYRLATAFFDADLENISDFYERALPAFHFEEGEADFPPTSPHVYEEKEKNKVLGVIVDTSGKTENVAEKYDVGILITRTEIVTKDASGNERRELIPKTPSKIEARTFFLDRMREQRPIAIGAMTFRTYLHEVVAKIALVALVAGVLLLGDKGKRQAYPFASYFNIACYAVTPFVLSAFVRATVSSSIATWVSYGISLMLFLALGASGLAACRRKDTREPEAAESPTIWTEAPP